MVQVLKKGFFAGLLAGCVAWVGAAPFTAVHHLGAWQHADQIYVHHLGSYQRIRRKWTHHDGAWRLDHVGLLLTNNSLTCNPGLISIRFNVGDITLRGVGGNCSSHITPANEWAGDTWDPALNGQYEARLTVSGAIFADPEFEDAGVWYSLGSAFFPQWWGPSGNNGSGTWTIEIRDAATQNIRATAVYTVSQSGG